MREKAHNWRKIGVLVSVLLLSALMACNPTRVDPPRVDKKTLKEFTQEERSAYAKAELERQQKREARMLKHGTRLHKIGQRVAKATVAICDRMPEHKALCVYRMHVKSSSKLAAWADGEDVYVTTAMMSMADDAQLAYVLAHELAHNLMEHQESSRVLAILGAAAGALLDKAASEYAGVPNNGYMEKGVLEAALKIYSPDQEREADYIGAYIAAEAGYDLATIADIWHKMTVKGYGDVYIESTHPTNPERLLALNMIIEEIQAKEKAGAVLVPNMKP